MQPAHEQQFDHFYGQREPQLMRFLLGMLGDGDLAAAAASETWVRYLRYVERPRPRFDAALLMAVARSAARRTGRLYAPGGPSVPAHRTVASAAERATREVLMLPDAEREAALLHYAASLPAADICRALGITRNELQRRLTDVRVDLRAAMPSTTQEDVERSLRRMDRVLDRWLEGRDVCASVPAGALRGHSWQPLHAAAWWIAAAALIACAAMAIR